MKIPGDTILLILLGILFLSLAAYFADLIPYPFGVLILLFLVMARMLYKN